MSMGGKFIAIVAIFKTRFKIYMRYTGWFVMAFIYPIFTTLMPVFLAISVSGSIQNASMTFYKYSGTKDMIFYILVGATVWSVSVNIIWDFGMWLYEEMEAGTLEQLLLSPATVSELLLGSILYTIVVSFTTAIISLFIAGLLFGYMHYILTMEFLVAMLIIAIGFVPLMGMSVFFGALVLKIKEPWSFFNFLTAFLVFIAGVFYPITVLSPIARYIAIAFPATLQIADSRAIILHLEFIFSPEIDLLIIISYAISWPIIGAIMFNRVERELKRRGSIGAH